MSFNTYLKSLRQEKQLSQRALADMINISNTEISRLESGERQKPSPIILKKISIALHIPLDDLMREAGYLQDQDNVIDQIKHFEEKSQTILTSYLIKNGWNLKENSNCNQNHWDLYAQNGSLNWVFNYNICRSDTFESALNNALVRNSYVDFLGKVCLEPDITKASFVVGNKKAYEILSGYQLVHLPIDISIILVDLELNCLSQEKYINQF